MANPSDTSPQPDWNALNQQFWQTWTGAASPATPAAPTGLPWHEGLELWSRMFSGQGGAQGDVAERMLAGAKQFAAFAQAATGSAAAGAANPWTSAYTQAFGPLSATSNPMLDAMKSMQGQGLKGFEQLAAEAQRMAGPARDEMMASMSLPAFGYTREQQERTQAFARASVELQERSAAYNALMLKASQRAFERMERKLAERSEPGREVGTLRGVYDLWIDAAEEGYAEVALSPEFRTAYGELVNAQMRVKKLVNAEIERSTQGVGMPTRTEIDAVHARLADLRRRLAQLEEAIGPSDVEEAMREPAGAARATSKTEPKPKSKSKPAKHAGNGKRGSEAGDAARTRAPQPFAQRLAATRVGGPAKPKHGRK